MLVSFCFESTFQEEHLDSQQGVIDFSLYLRNKKDVGNDDNCDAASSSEASATSGGGNMAAVLDQKTYIEEVNQTLK